MTLNLTGAALYAAYSQQIYRVAVEAGAGDLGLTLPGDSNEGGSPDLPGLRVSLFTDPTAIALMAPAASPLHQDVNTGYWYNASTGFVGMIVKDGAKATVVFRGTDAGDFSFAHS